MKVFFHCVSPCHATFTLCEIMASSSSYPLSLVCTDSDTLTTVNGHPESKVLDIAVIWPIYCLWTAAWVRTASPARTHKLKGGQSSLCLETRYVF